MTSVSPNRVSGASLARTRVAGVAGAVWGTLLVVGTHRFVGRAPVAVALTRLLGARYLAQGAVLTGAHRPPVRIVRTLDVLHAVSMVALTGSSRYRRPALLSAAIATGLVILAGAGPSSSPCAVRR
jgi:hypothetical protein